MNVPLVKCSCTIGWCQTKVADGQVPPMGFFMLPKTNSADPTRIAENIEARLVLERKLRPCAAKPSTLKSKPMFLWWHLYPQSFEWKDTFSRNAKKKIPGWIVKARLISQTKQAPPPQNVPAVWNGHVWTTAVGNRKRARVDDDLEPSTPPSAGRGLKSAKRLVTQCAGGKGTATTFSALLGILSTWEDETQVGRQANEEATRKHADALGVSGAALVQARATSDSNAKEAKHWKAKFARCLREKTSNARELDRIAQNNARLRAYLADCKKRCAQLTKLNKKRKKHTERLKAQTKKLQDLHENLKATVGVMDKDHIAALAQVETVVG
jgi:hypothetical protein